FVYKEDVSIGQAAFLWGNSAFALATRLTDSFAKYRWCSNIVGSFESLPVYLYKAAGGPELQNCTDVVITERREFELSQLGFISLTCRKDSTTARFFSANSCQRPHYYAAGSEAERNSRIAAQLPFTFIASRITHYLKALQRDSLPHLDTRGLET